MEAADRSFTGSFTCDGEGWVRSCNPRFAEILGVASVEAAVGSNLLSFFVTSKIGGGFLRRLRAENGVWGEEAHWKSPGRGDITVAINAWPTTGEADEPAVTGEVLDLTDHRQLAEQLAHCQRVAAVGQLASGVAHDFNNILSIITGYSDLLLDEAGDNANMRMLVEEVIRATERGAGLTRQLLAFTRRRPSTPTVVDLNALVTGLHKVVNRLVGEGIDVVCETTPELYPVRADLGQLEQVVINLVINSRDAMPTGGQIAIGTRNTTVTTPVTTCHDTVTAGEYAVLSIRDSGTGMDAGVLSRIFEPFFTTKAQGRGTGLGLANSFRLIKQVGGSTLVTSEPGAGTTFEIYLPRCAEEQRDLARTREVRPMRGSETVLLVEDDEFVRKTVVRILGVNGYKVLAAAMADEAMALAAEYDRPIHLLLADVVLPGKSGPHLAAELLVVRPDMRVLFMSGYTDEAAEVYGLSRESGTFLAKPFTVVELATKVRNVLDGVPVSAD